MGYVSNAQRMAVHASKADGGKGSPNKKKSPVKAKNLESAQIINDQIFPLAQAFYSPPFLDMHNRMKEVLVLTGKMEEAIVRPPLMKLSSEEINKLKKAIQLSKI